MRMQLMLSIDLFGGGKAEISFEAPPQRGPYTITGLGQKRIVPDLLSVYELLKDHADDRTFEKYSTFESYVDEWVEKAIEDTEWFRRVDFEIDLEKENYENW